MKFENKKVIVTVHDGQLSVVEPGRLGYEFNIPVNGKVDFPEIALALGEEMIKLINRGNRVNQELELLKTSIQLLHNQL